MADAVAFSIGIHTDEAKKGHEQIIAWNTDIAASYGKILSAAKEAGAGLGLGAANGNTAGILGLEKAVNGLSASMEKLVQSQAAFIKSAQESVQSSTARTTASKAAAQAAETEAQALDRITQRMAAAKAAREAQTQATTQQKAAQDALNASVAAGAGGQVSNAGLLATAKVAQDATASVEKLTKARIDDEAASAALVKSADTLVGKYAPLIKQQQQLAADKEAFNKLQKAGTLTATEEAAILSGLTAKTQMMDAAQKSLAGSMKLSHNNTLALNAAFVNFGQSIMAGMNPLTALTTQLGQAAPALGEMAVKSGTSGAAIAGIAVPAIATAAAIAIAVVSYEKYTGSLRDFDNVNKLAGNSVGMTRDQMAAYADSIASATGVSSAFARETIAAYTKLGSVATPVMSSLIAITKDYAAVTGQSKDEAAKALGAMFTDPAKGAQELATKYGVINGAQLLYIQQLTASGQKTQAQTLLVDALGRRIAGAAEQTSWWARTWDAVGTSASEAATKIGRAIDEAVNGMSPQRQLAQTEKRISELRANLSKPTYSIPLFGEYESGSGKAVDTTKDRAELAALEASVSQLRLRITEDNRRSFIKGMVNDANKASVAAVETTQRYDDLGQMLNKANADLAVLQKGMGPGMGAAAGEGGKAVEALQNQIKDLNTVRTSGLDLATYKSQELAKIDAKYAGNTSPQVAVQIAQEKERINVLGTATTTAQRKAQVDTATASAQAGVTHAAAEATVQLSLQTQAQERLAAAAGQGEAAQRRAAIENQVAAAAVKGLGDATRQALEAQEASARTQIHADFAGSIKLEVDATERLVAGMQKGAEATRDAQVYNEAYAQTIKEAVPTEADFGKKLADNIVLLEKKAKSLDSKAFEDYNKQIEGQTRQLQLQQKLVGATPQQAARLQSEHDINELLIKQGRNYENLSEGERKIIDAARDRSIQNAELEQQIARQKDAYDTIANSLEKSFERVGDAIVNAFVEGKGSAVDFGNIAKGIVSSLITDLVKMAAIRPLSNAMFGTNYGTLWDLSVSSPGAAGQGGGSSLTNSLLSKGVSYGADKLFPSATGGITSAIDSFGYSTLGIGSVSYGAPMVASNGMLAGGGATSLATPTGISGGLGTTLGAAAPYGFLGGMGGAYLSNQFMGGSKVGGALSGAALGVGSMAAGTAAMGAMGMGAAASAAGVSGMAGATAALSAIPVYGWIAAAVLAAITAIAGTQKPTVGPTASADVTINAGGKSATYGNVQTDNDGDPAAGKGLGNALSTIFSLAAMGGGTLTKDFGIGQTAAKGLYVAGSVPYKEFGKGDNALGDALRYMLIEQGGLKGGGANTIKALQNTKATDWEEAAKDIGLGAQIDAGNTALKSMIKTLGGLTDAAKKAADESFKPMIDDLIRAQKLGIGDAYKALATDQLKEYLDQLRNPPNFTQAEQDMAALKGQFQSAREAYAQLNPEMVTYVDQIERETRARLAAGLNLALDQQTNEASGRGYVNQISGFLTTLSENTRSLAAVGEPATRANNLFNASLGGLLKTLTTDQLSDVVRTFGGDIGRLATQLTTANDNAQQTANTLQQTTQFETLLGKIRQDNAQAQITALNEQKSAANSLLSSWKNLQSSIGQARQSLLVGDLSTLDPRSRMDAALSSYRDALSRAQGGDVDAAGQVSGLAQTALTAARAYYASNEDYARIFNEVTGGLGDVESVASRQVTLASQQVSRLDTQISIQQDTLRALQTVPADIAAIIRGINSGNSADIWQWSRNQDSGTRTQLQTAVLNSFSNADIEAKFGGFSDIQAARAADPSFNLADWFQKYGKNEVLSGARSIPGFAAGGIVGNGMFGVDSVIASYAGGGNIALAGGEYVMPANQTAMYRPALDAMRAGAWGAANDRWSGSNVVPYQPRYSGNSGGQSADIKRQNELLEEQNRLLTALLRTTAAAGDGTLNGLAEVADNVKAVAKKAAGGGLRE
ncbi:phage tail length tape measure family protein [Azospirillum sp. A26]|uniref:phage tail length tape measure family protein n=1 Tax=Azospirillum sp. A26 TaxID=3160607 RepID=UPI0036700431